MSECVFSSEIKTHAVKTYKRNFKDNEVYGDITKIHESTIPNFDFLLAGFPCQSFSNAGKRLGFDDIRGTLFFDILRILKEKKPQGFILENVEGLVNHNKGETLKTILRELEKLSYNVAWKIFNSADFGIPQNRKRIYIVGHTKKIISLDNFVKHSNNIGQILEPDIKVMNGSFVKLLLDKYNLAFLKGKSIKDKRGGGKNIHSWDIDLKGCTSDTQKELLNILLKKRRLKKWAVEKGIQWMDGMPLTLGEIKTFFNHNDLPAMLEDLVEKGYLKYEHPKNLFFDNNVKVRKYDFTKPKGYNIVTGKLSFPISELLSPDSICPTIVATEIGKLTVVVEKGVRNFTVREGLRLFGYPEWYSLECLSYKECFDLLGNTVTPPIIKEITKKVFVC